MVEIVKPHGETREKYSKGRYLSIGCVDGMISRGRKRGGGREMIRYDNERKNSRAPPSVSHKMMHVSTGEFWCKI